MRKNLARRAGLSLLIGFFVFGMTVFANPIEEDQYARVNKEGVTLKNAPLALAFNAGELEKDELIRIGEQVDDYIEVLLDFGTIAYIEVEHIEEIKQTEEVKETEDENTVQEEVKLEKGQEVVKFAIKHVGNPYVYGGNSLTKGTDCSGFTSQVFKHFGVNIQRTSGGQYAGAGTKVAKSDLKAGDLVFFGYNGRVNHVAIYIGDNKIVHAGTAKTGIHISPLQQRGMAPYIGAKRVI